jgi:hypothetical protein
VTRLDPESADATRLRGLLDDFDPELRQEVAAVLEGWAEQNAMHERDFFAVNPRSSRSAADCAALAATLLTAP